MTRSQVQAKLQAIEQWFHDKLVWLLFYAFLLSLPTLFGLPDLHRAIRLLRSSHTEPIVIESGHSQILGGPGGTLLDQTAQVSGNARKFPADKLYSKGDHAFLTYSEALDYGVITAQPPHSTFEILSADGEANDAASFPISSIVALTITNLGLILLALLRHTLGTGLTEQLSEKSGRFERGLTIGTAILEGLLAGTLSFIPIAAVSAAFSVAIQMKSDRLSSLYVIYVLLMLFLGSHVAAGMAIGLLKFLRSKFGRGLKEFLAYAASLAAAVHIARNIVGLTFSKRVVDVSSWWAVAKEFVEALFK